MTSKALLLIALVPFFGCFGSSGPPMGTVSGTVTYEGAPIAEGTIIFEVSGARPATGKIADGEIVEVTTLDPNDGVAIGPAQIAIFAFEPEKPKPPAQVNPTPAATNPGMSSGSSMPVRKSTIPTRYNNPATSGLTFEIKPGENRLDFELGKK